MTDALGGPVVAAWWSGPDGTAVVETARSIGLTLVGGAQSNDSEVASTRGVVSSVDRFGRTAAWERTTALAETIVAEQVTRWA